MSTLARSCNRALEPVTATVVDESKELGGALIGAWKLVSFTHLDEAGAEIAGPFGERPLGRIVYTESGHMLTVILAGEREAFSDVDIRQADEAEKVAAFDTMAAYSGRYELIGKRVVHHVDLAWIPGWKGSHLDRTVEFSEDGRLILTGPPMKIGGRTLGVKIVWERES